jgi:hypothetical protein
MRENASTTPAAFLSETGEYSTRLVRRRKSATRRPLKKRPVPPVGSVWLGRAK